MKTLKIIASMAVMLPHFAFAGRSITVIPSNATALKLVNPSTANLTYNLSCKDTAGTEYLNQNLSIPSGTFQSNSIVSGPHHCTETESVVYTSGMVKCMVASPVNYDQAATACRPGNHVCTVAEWDSKRGGGPAFDNGWLDASAYSSFSWSSDGSSWTNYTNPPDVPTTSVASNERTAQFSSGGGSWTYYTWIHSRSMLNGAVMCCADNNTYTPPGGGNGTPGFCKIQVNENTGHLICPDFKGGTPF